MMTNSTISDDRLDSIARGQDIPHDHDLRALARELQSLRALINSPVVDEWFNGVRIEAVHQQVRWYADYDAGKTPADWFWLLGYLGGKALASAIKGDVDKAKHHTISSGAAMFNWWRALSGDPNAKMRPGTDR